MVAHRDNVAVARFVDVLFCFSPLREAEMESLIVCAVRRAGCMLLIISCC